MSMTDNSLMVKNNLAMSFVKIRHAEAKVLLAILSKASLNKRTHKSNSKEVTLETKELKKLMWAEGNLTLKKMEEIFADFKNVVNVYRDLSTEVSDNIVLLERYTFGKEESKFLITESLSEFLEEPENNFCIITMLEAMKLKDKHAFNLYLFCAKWETVGYYEFKTIQAFRQALNISDSYTVKNISQKVLKLKEGRYTLLEEINRDTRFSIKIEPILYGKQKITGYRLYIRRKIDSKKPHEIIGFLKGKTKASTSPILVKAKARLAERDIIMRAIKLEEEFRFVAKERNFDLTENMDENIELFKVLLKELTFEDIYMRIRWLFRENNTQELHGFSPELFVSEKFNAEYKSN